MAEQKSNLSIELPKRNATVIPKAAAVAEEGKELKEAKADAKAEAKAKKPIGVSGALSPDEEAILAVCRKHPMGASDAQLMAAVDIPPQHFLNLLNGLLAKACNASCVCITFHRCYFA